MAIEFQNTTAMSFSVGQTGPEPKFYPITIKVVENGYRVEVGCKEFVFQDMRDMFAALGEYFANPEAAKEKYCRK